MIMMVSERSITGVAAAFSTGFFADGTSKQTRNEQQQQHAGLHCFLPSSLQIQYLAALSDATLYADARTSDIDKDPPGAFSNSDCVFRARGPAPATQHSDKPCSSNRSIIVSAIIYKSFCQSRGRRMYIGRSLFKSTAGRPVRRAGPQCRQPAGFQFESCQ